MKKELIVKCDCNCSCLSLDKFEEEVYYITLYKSTNKNFIHRLKESIKYLFGKRIVDTEIVLNKEEFDKIKKF